MILKNEQDAIKQATEAGYDDSILRWGEMIMAAKIALILQEPAFWQALGKARGWEQRCDASECEDRDEWREHQHEWLDANDDALLSGGDMKAFWESLP